MAVHLELGDHQGIHHKGQLRPDHLPAVRCPQASGQLEEALQAAESEGRSFQPADEALQRQPRQQRRGGRQQQQQQQRSLDGNGRSQMDASGREILASMSDDEGSDMLTAR